MFCSAALIAAYFQAPQITVVGVVLTFNAFYHAENHSTVEGATLIQRHSCEKAKFIHHIDEKQSLLFSIVQGMV